MEEFLTASEVAEALGRTPGTIRNWIRTGLLEALILPTVGKGKHPSYRIKKADVLAIKQREREKGMQLVLGEHGKVELPACQL